MPKIYFVTRTCQLIHVKEACIQFYKELQGALKEIVFFCMSFPWKSSMKCVLIYFLGLVFSLLSIVETTLYSLVASTEQFQVLQYHILRDNQSCDMKSHFDIIFYGLISTIMTFDLSNFTSNDIIPPKAHYIGQCHFQ